MGCLDIPTKSFVRFERGNLIIGKEGARAVALCVLIGDKIVLLNPVLERWIGLPAEELMGRSLIDLVHPNDREPLKDAIERIYDGLGALFIGVKMITRGKGVLWVVLTLNPVIYREREAILVNIVDMTELRKVECSANDELFELQKAIFEAIPHAIVGLENRRIIFANNAVYDIFGWRPDELIGKTMRVLFHSDREYEEEGRKFYSILRKKRTHRIEFTYKRKDGRDVVCITSVSRIGDDPECRRVVATHTDITEMKRIERECNRLHEQLRKYTNHLHDMLERERSVIAREIHDEIGQTLTALKMGLFRIKEEVKGKSGKLETELTSMINLVEGAIRSTRDLVAQLRPVLLDDLGFIPAMEWLIDEFQRMTDVEVDVVLHPVIEHIKLDKRLSANLYRILQEILTNIARHANATRVQIKLSYKRGSITLLVRDNGRGIKREEVVNPRSFGILSMRERASLLGGRFWIRGWKGKGTTVRVQIPLSAEGSDGGNKCSYSG